MEGMRKPNSSDRAIKIKPCLIALLFIWVTGVRSATNKRRGASIVLELFD
jgi:hypothetical protein